MTIEPRRLALPHFAFYRAYLEGPDAVDLAALADRYLGVGRDPRLCRATLVWLQDELTAAARRLGDREAVRLLRLPKRLDGAAVPPGDRPSLEAFRERVDAESVYGEAELLVLYRQAFPETPRLRLESRGIRLRARRFDALRRLELAVAEPPASEHSVDGWLDPVLAARLRAAGVVTLAHLVDMINESGHRWYRHVPRVGPQAAARIVRWLSAHAGSLATPLRERALTPIRRQARETLMAQRTALTQLAPLETLQLTASLSGAEGSNRAPSADNRTGAGHDLAAIDAWLNDHRAGSHTWRSYRAQAERLVLWSVFERGKPLSSLAETDIAAYQAFLADPPPHWLGKRATPRWSSAWRPFAGPLAPASRATALGVLKSLFQWLMERGYLRCNPSLGAAPSLAERQSLGLKAHHALTRAQWHAVMAHARNHLRDVARERACVMLLLGYLTGLRLAEMARATAGALKPRRIGDAADTAWILAVDGRGGTLRHVPVPEQLMAALGRYLVARGLPDDPRECPPATPLIARLSPSGNPSLGAPALAAAFKKLFAAAASAMAGRDADAAHRLATASAHWLRHTHGIRAIEAGVPLDILQEHLGHASAATTAIYAAEVSTCPTPAMNAQSPGMDSA